MLKNSDYTNGLRFGETQIIVVTMLETRAQFAGKTNFAFAKSKVSMSSSETKCKTTRKQSKYSNTIPI